MKKIEFQDGGAATVNHARGTLVLQEEEGAQTCVALDDVGAMLLAEALTNYVAITIGRNNDNVVRGATAAIAQLTDLAKCRPER